jgi:hypothetical protein
MVAPLLAREIGNRRESARAHDGLARAHRELGRRDLAREHAEQARDLYAELGFPQAQAAAAFLAGL